MVNLGFQWGVVSVPDAERHLQTDKRRSIAITLIDDVDRFSDDIAEKLFVKIAHQISAGDYNSLHTYSGRYSAVDPIVVEEIDRHFGPKAPLSVHDMAVSNGVTAVELFRTLGDRPNLSYFASDAFNFIYLVESPSLSWRVVFDAGRRPIQFIGRRMVIAAPSLDRPKWLVAERTDRFVNDHLQKRLMKKVLPRASSILDSCPEHVRKIPVLHPTCRDLLRTDTRFEFGEHDILSGADKTVDVVRLMGVVRAMPQDMLESIFRSVAGSLNDGGLFVAGTTPEGCGEAMANVRGSRINTTIFEKKQGRLLPIKEIFGPYLFKDLVASLEL